MVQQLQFEEVVKCNNVTNEYPTLSNYLSSNYPDLFPINTFNIYDSGETFQIVNNQSVYSKLVVESSNMFYLLLAQPEINTYIFFLNQKKSLEEVIIQGIDFGENSEYIRFTL